MKADRYLFPHYKFYVREVKIKAYAQLLESYSSLTLGYMAQAFGVTEKYIDEELSKFIAGGRLHAKIDKVNFRVNIRNSCYYELQNLLTGRRHSGDQQT